MTSWRDNASDQAQNDLDGLLSPALDSAHQQLASHGQFYPYAVVVDASGARSMVCVDTQCDHPQSMDVMSALLDILTAKRQDLRAAAIVANVTLKDSPGEAVRVALEHREGPHLAVLQPYRRNQSPHSLDYDQLRAITTTRQLW